MSGRSVRRLGALTIALLIAMQGTAFAQDPTTTEPPPPPSSSAPPSPEPTPSEPAPSEPTPPPPTSTTQPEPAPPPAPTSTPPPPSQPPPVAEPSPAPSPNTAPDLKVSAAFDKPSYTAADIPRVTVTIRNTGDAPAEGVRASGGGDLDVWGAWGDLTTGIRIRPHETRTVELSGRILNATNDKVTFTAQITGDSTPANNSTFIEVPLVDATGQFGGTVVADINDNGTIDPGEGLAGVRISMSGGVPFGEFKVTTDAQGKFALRDLPLGVYSVSYDSPQPWITAGLSGTGFDDLNIDGSGKYANVSITAVRHLFDFLHVRMAFDRPSYAPDDTTKVAATLTNTSGRDLTGITAVHCVGSPDTPDLRGGEGWGPLAPGAAGVTVPARSTTTVEVTEPVPAASAKFGYVSAFCYFGPANHPIGALVRAEATAKVPGVLDTARLRLAHDRDGNGRVDEGEGIPGVTVTLFDQDTGVTVTQAATDNDGLFAAADVPVGVYEWRVSGPWNPTNCVRTLAVVGDGGIGTPTCFLLPGTGQEGKRPNVRVSAVFDKPEFESGDTIRVTFILSNVGDADAEGVTATSFFHPWGLEVDRFHGGWGELDQVGPGARIAVGQVRVFNVFGTARNVDAGIVTFAGSVLARNGDSYFANNGFDLVAPLTKTTGRYNGVIFADRNGNGEPDTGEGLGGITVFAFGGVPSSGYSRTTDAQGRFDFEELPTGRYGVGFEDPTGRWVPLGESGKGTDEFTLDKSGHLDARILAIPPLSDTLVPSVKFTKDSYAPGELARLTVTLTNKGAKERTGITATCRSEAPNGLRGGPGWAPLQEGGPGVSVPAGATRNFEVSEQVPEGARQAGTVFASCRFGANGHPPAGHPSVFAEARVPGAIGSGQGRLVRDDDSQTPIPDTKVVLLDGFTGKPAAKTRSGADGRFEFRDLPVGRYELRIVGPWRLVNEFNKSFFVSDPLSDNGNILLAPGPQQPDPFPDVPPTLTAPVAPPAPQPQGAAAPTGLASTGASVIGLGVAGLLLLLAGFGAVAAVRRRRA